ncbi:MAG: iron-containing alcohol dehydrogenase [Desulfuromonadales bacterium]|nr:iron-containing alcohol dehydrogenase [Desulfuromonadales bacterium]
MNIQHLRKFLAPEFVFGVGSRHLVGRQARNLGGRKALVVTDPGVVAAGWTREVCASLEEAGIVYEVFAAVSPNPRAAEVMAGAEIFHATGCDFLVAVGGGSPIDCAKGIGVVSTGQRHILEFQGVDEVREAMPPLICIPTTAGTGADVSQFAIIADPAERVKVAIVSAAVVPNLSLVDPQTLTSMDPYLTACTGLDALTHGIEAFVSSAHSPMTDLHALEAIRLVATHLETAVREPTNQEVRSQLMLGSLHAGLAFSNAILGATHAMAHSLGGYLDLAHGECNALLLDHVAEFNFSAAPERFERIGEALGLDLRGLNAGQRRRAILGRLRGLKQAVGLGRHLRELGVSLGDVGSLSRKALRDACLVTNPRRAGRRDLEVIYEEAL